MRAKPSPLETGSEVCPRCGLRHRAETPCPAALVGKTLAGRFLVVRLIGSGGSAAVYKAQNLAVGRFVAVKILHPHLRADAHAVERFVREGRAMSRVRHEGVVDVLDLITTEDGAPMLVLEYVRARTLSAEIKRIGPLPLDRAMNLAGQLLSTLAAVHDRALVHRDLKPSNLLLGLDPRKRERLKVADFGLAVSLDGEGEHGGPRERVTPPGRVLATPRYLAPELLKGSDGRDVRVDIYGAGLVVYEMLAGRPAFEAAHMDELADAIVNAQPPSASARRPDVPAALDQAIARALAKKPGERYPSAWAMLEALRPFGAVSDVIAAEPTDTGLLEVPRDPRVDAYRAALARSARREAEGEAAAGAGPRPDSGRPTPAQHPRSVFPRPDETEATGPNESAPAAASRFEAALAAMIHPALPGDLRARALRTPAPPAPAALPAFDPAAVTRDLGPAPRAAPTPATPAPAPPPGGLVRGPIAATLLSAIARRFGDAPLQGVLRALPEETRAVLSGPIRDDGWIPGDALAALIETADVRLGKGDGALCVGFGRLAARTLLPGAHAHVLREATPESALIEAGALWKRYFEIGELKVPAVGRGYGKLELRNGTGRRSTCLAISGFVEVLLELAGGRDAEIVTPTCRALGDATCTFDANWMV